MTTIRNRAALMPEQIQQAVKIVFINTGREVAELVPDLIEWVDVPQKLQVLSLTEIQRCHRKR
jgi:hypothetical protein